MSNNEDKFDAIIVGAGPAGSACAYTLARAGKAVLVIERGDSPGCKNMTGGRLYTYALELLDKGLHEEAPLERKVTHEQLMMLSVNRSVSIDYHNPSFNAGEQAPMSYTVLRGRFDEWLAGKAEEMGAIVACGIKVDGLIEKNGKIAGILAGEDEMYADVVIAADGVNSFMGRQAGLRGDIQKETVGIGVKEVIELPAKTIEERFNLKVGEGAARMLLGCSEGIHGGGFLYTNQDSISLGIVLMPEEIAHRKKSVYEILQQLKEHPSICPLIEGGKTIEYSAHLVSEAGFRGLPPKLYRDGFLMVGDAAGFVISTGYSVRGIDLAIVSGIAAARAVLASGNADAVGPQYLRELDSLKLMPAMKALDGYFTILETPWIYDKLPSLANDVFDHLFTVSGEIPAKMKKSMQMMIQKNGLSLWQFIKLSVKGIRAL